VVPAGTQVKLLDGLTAPATLDLTRSDRYPQCSAHAPLFMSGGVSTRDMTNCLEKKGGADVDSAFPASLSTHDSQIGPCARCV